MDVAELRKRILRELDRPVGGDRTGADRRASADSARVQFNRILNGTIAPLLIQTASILKAEGELCQVHTPSDTAKIAFDSSHEDFIEFMLDTTPPAHIIGRGSVRRKPNCENTPVSKWVIAEMRSPASVSTSSPTP